MRRVITSLVMLFLTIHVNANNDMNGQPSAIGLDYFGEQPPGLTPQLFEPKIVSPNGLFEGGRFSPDKREYYFSRNSGKYKKRTFFVMHYDNQRWGEASETDIRWPQFSPGGHGRSIQMVTEIG